jgi:transposase
MDSDEHKVCVRTLRLKGQTGKLAKIRMAKSVLDAGWELLRRQLQYKGQQAGRV